MHKDDNHNTNRHAGGQTNTNTFALQYKRATFNTKDYATGIPELFCTDLAMRGMPTATETFTDWKNISKDPVLVIIK